MLSKRRSPLERVALLFLQRMPQLCVLLKPREGREEPRQDSREKAVTEGSEPPGSTRRREAEPWGSVQFSACHNQGFPCVPQLCSFPVPLSSATDACLNSAGWALLIHCAQRELKILRFLFITCMIPKGWSKEFSPYFNVPVFRYSSSGLGKEVRWNVPVCSQAGEGVRTELWPSFAYLGCLKDLCYLNRSEFSETR